MKPNIKKFTKHKIEHTPRTILFQEEVSQ